MPMVQTGGWVSPARPSARRAARIPCRNVYSAGDGPIAARSGAHSPEFPEPIPHFLSTAPEKTALSWPRPLLALSFEGSETPERSAIGTGAMGWRKNVAIMAIKVPAEQSALRSSAQQGLRRQTGSIVTGNVNGSLIQGPPSDLFTATTGAAGTTRSSKRRALTQQILHKPPA